MIHKLACAGSGASSVKVLQTQAATSGLQEHLAIAQALSVADRNWLQQLPIVLQLRQWHASSTVGITVVHAGLRPGTPIDKHAPNTLMNVRDILPDGSATAIKGAGTAWIDCTHTTHHHHHHRHHHHHHRRVNSAELHTANTTHRFNLLLVNTSVTQYGKAPTWLCMATMRCVVCKCGHTAWDWTQDVATVAASQHWCCQTKPWCRCAGCCARASAFASNTLCLIHAGASSQSILATNQANACTWNRCASWYH